ncbi:MAG TPA: DUF3618 domain-containing protein [Longimicrobiales bacterium]|nr:DUF3618 domain-containing protein [Longimicrobiales bacterium]
MSDRSEHEIRESIEATRARMGETIEQIGDRVNPERVKAELKARAREQIHEAKDNMKRKARNTMRDVEHGVSDTGRGIWATIRENPVPAGMVGVGLAWLIANRRDAEDRHYEYGTYSTGPAVPYRPGHHTGSQFSELGQRPAGAYGAAGEYSSPRQTEAGEYGATGGYGVGGVYGGSTGYEGRVDARSTGYAGSPQWREEEGGSEGIREKASEVLHRAEERLSDAQERVGSALHGAQERVGEVVHGGRERVSGWGHEAKQRARRAEHRVEESMRENPVAAGAMALAIGVAAGLMIPETDREREVMGRTRDRVLDKAQTAVRTRAEELHEKARDAAGETARKAVDEVWPGSDGTETTGYSEPRRY